MLTVSNSMSFNHKMVRAKRLFGEGCTNAEVLSSVRHLPYACARGRVASFLCYGGSGSGKSHTIHGSESDVGVMYGLLTELFNYASSVSSAGEEGEEEGNDEAQVPVSLGAVSLQGIQVFDLCASPADEGGEETIPPAPEASDEAVSPPPSPEAAPEILVPMEITPESVEDFSFLTKTPVSSLEDAISLIEKVQARAALPSASEHSTVYFFFLGTGALVVGDLCAIEHLWEPSGHPLYDFVSYSSGHGSGLPSACPSVSLLLQCLYSPYTVSFHLLHLSPLLQDALSTTRTLHLAGLLGALLPSAPIAQPCPAESTIALRDSIVQSLSDQRLLLNQMEQLEQALQTAALSKDSNEAGLKALEPMPDSLRASLARLSVQNRRNQYWEAISSESSHARATLVEAASLQELSRSHLQSEIDQISKEMSELDAHNEKIEALLQSMDPGQRTMHAKISEMQQSLLACEARKQELSAIVDVRLIKPNSILEKSIEEDQISTSTYFSVTSFSRPSLQQAAIPAGMSRGGFRGAPGRGATTLGRGAMAQRGQAARGGFSASMAMRGRGGMGITATRGGATRGGASSTSRRF